MDAEPQMEMAASPSLWEQAMLTVHLSFQELQQEVPEQLSRRCLEKRYSEELKAESKFPPLLLLKAVQSFCSFQADWSSTEKSSNKFPLNGFFPQTVYCWGS